jgi:hypothetical protein
MLSVEEAVSDIRKQSERNWVLWALDKGRWPHSVRLKAPRGAEFDRDITAAQLWSASWASAQRDGLPGTVSTEARRARGLGSHQLPTTWTLTEPFDALSFTPELQQKYCRARERFAAAVEIPEVAWDSFESIPLKSAKIVADLSDDDWRNAIATITHLAAGAGEATILRQLAVPGVHTKWIEDNAALLVAMLGVPAGTGDPKARLEEHIGLLAEKSPVPVYLACPTLRAEAAGMDRFAATITALNGGTLNPRAILIVENRKLGHGLDFTIDGLAVIYGLGSGVTALVDLRWTATADTVLYWGDLDRRGLAILASLRRAGVPARSVLMDEVAWDRYPDGQHHSPRDQLLSDVEVPEGLEGSEHALYERLNSEHRCGGKDLQLEQEHIPLPDVVTAVTALLAG